MGLLHEVAENLESGMTCRAEHSLTGIWLVPSGSLTLCSKKDTDHIGRYQRVTVRLRAWGQCGHCREMLMMLEPSGCQPMILHVTSETGFTSEMPNPNCCYSSWGERHALEGTTGARTSDLHPHHRLSEQGDLHLEGKEHPAG